MVKGVVTLTATTVLILAVECNSKKTLSEQEQTNLDQDLCIAAFNNDFDKAYEAIQRGANVNTAKCGSNMTPLFLAILGGAPDLTNKYDLIPMSKVMAKHQIVDALIEAGANVNSQTANGMTALIYARRTDNDETLIEKLLKAGADPDLRDKQGMTSGDWAKKKDEQPVRASADKAMYWFEVTTMLNERKKELIKKKVELDQ